MFYAFDLLHLDGWDLTGAALEDRKAALAALMPPQCRGQVALQRPSGRARPAISSAMPAAIGLEGIVSKRRDSPYRAGRHDSWLKVKCANREEFVVIGFSDPAGGRQGLGALLLGYYDPQGELALRRPRRHRVQRCAAGRICGRGSIGSHRPSARS